MNLTKIAKKQNQLLILCYEYSLNRSLKISIISGTPTINELQYKLFPEYEKEIDAAIHFLEFNAIKPMDKKNNPDYPKLWQFKNKVVMRFLKILKEKTDCK